MRILGFALKELTVMFQYQPNSRTSSDPDRNLAQVRTQSPLILLIITVCIRCYVMIRIWGCIWWQEIVGRPPVTQGPQSLLSKPPTIGLLHSCWNWNWDKTARGRDKTADLRQIQERWVNFCHSTAERWSGSIGKKRARKTARSFQCEKEIAKNSSTLSTWKKRLGKQSWSIDVKKRRCVQKQKQARVFIPFRTTGARPCFVPTVTYIWNWPLRLCHSSAKR